MRRTLRRSVARSIPPSARLILALGALLAAACGDAGDASDPLDDPGISRSRFNAFRCLTCHETGPAGTRIVPGARLDGALARRSFWGGALTDPFEATDACFTRFLRGDSLAREPVASARILRRLGALSASPDAITEPVPFTVVRDTRPPGEGSAERGRDLYDRACAYCHGAAHTGEGRVGRTTSILPEDTEQLHRRDNGYTLETLRHLFVHKVRLGSFEGFSGAMPPFSREVLSDAALDDIVAYLSPTLR
jgi:thiosulfate dehydrogenase